jgi:hypothetical protein
MRESPFGIARNLIGVYNERKSKYKKGDYTLEIQNNYNIRKLNSSKLIHIVRTNEFGGDNSFLGILLIIVGCFCGFYAIIHVIKFLIDFYKKYKLKNYKPVVTPSISQ